MKMKLKNLGSTPPKVVETKAVSNKPKVRYPSVTLSADKLPELEDIKYGKKATLMFEGEVTGISTAGEWENVPKGTQMVTFELKAGACYGDGAGSKALKSGGSLEDATSEAAEEAKDHESLKRVKSKMKGY